MKNKFILNVRWFIISLIFLNLVLAVWAVPIYDLGDSPTYILFSKVLLGQEEYSITTRSPLYAYLLAGFMLIFDPPFYYKAIVIFQYILVGTTSWMIYRIFKFLFFGNGLPMIIALLFNLSLSTIFFANILLTEVLTVFLLIWSVYLFFKLSVMIKFNRLLLLGVVIALLALARFNTIPIAFTYVLLLTYFFYSVKKTSLLETIKYLSAFILPFLLIINLWCLYNYKNNNFYGLFPRFEGGPSRNVIIASIRPENKVSEENMPVLQIFLDARERYRGKIPSYKKGSLAELDKLGFLTDLYSGFQIYGMAKADLRDHFDLKGNEGEYELNMKLAGFYREISRLNRNFIFKMRFVSFFSGFRAAATVLPDEYGKINTNLLPSFVVVLYKLLIPLMSFFVFFSGFYFVINIIKNKVCVNFPLLVFYLIVFSFWGINFYFVTESNANRYKFPTEPFIIGIFLYYITLLVKYLQKRRFQPARHVVVL